MGSEQPPVGAPFSHVYLRPSAPMKDSQRFRNRLAAYVLSEFDCDKLDGFLQIRIGAVQLHTSKASRVKINSLFKDGQMRDVLDAITYVADYLKHELESYGAYHYNQEKREGLRRRLHEWRSFVMQLFKEENLGYSLDDGFDVRYQIDMEFEHVRLAAVAHLGSPRYQAVLQEFEAAYRFIEANPPDTKLAVRSMFEGTETLFKLMAGRKARRLGSSEIKTFLLPIVNQLYAADRLAANAVRQLVEGLAAWADGLQAYRHGQAVEEPSPPPVETAVAVLQTGSAYIRLLAELDRKLQAGSAEGA